MQYSVGSSLAGLLRACSLTRYIHHHNSLNIWRFGDRSLRLLKFNTLSDVLLVECQWPAGHLYVQSPFHLLVVALRRKPEREKGAKKHKMVKNVRDAGVFLAGIVFGTASSILSKELFEQTVNGVAFKKPLFQTTLMFFGMLLALPIHLIYERWSQRNASKKVALRVNIDSDDTSSQEYTLLAESPSSQQSYSASSNQWTFRSTTILLIPSMFDLLATALANIGLVMIEVSIYQLMKCTVIVFVAILKRVFMHTRLRPYMWAGVALNMIAVTLVASTSFISFGSSSSTGSSTNSSTFYGTGTGTSGNDTQVVQLLTQTSGDLEVASKSDSENAGLGILLIVLSCAVQSAQYVFEEKVMGAHDDSATSFPPLVVVGMEGFWGLLMSLFIVLPVAAALPGNDCTSRSCSYENTWDTLRMCGDSSTIVWMLFAYVCIITGYNAAGIGITYLCDSVWHSILDNFRPVSVWATQLVIYKVSSGKSGEAWVATSWIQLGGLVLLLFGTAVYNSNIRLCCFSYPGYSRGDLVEIDVEATNSQVSSFQDADHLEQDSEEPLATSLTTSPYVTARSPNVRAILSQRR